MHTDNTSLENEKQPSCLGAVSGSFHYTLEDIVNIKANAQFLKDKIVPIEVFGLPEFMDAVIKLADDSIKSRNDR
jgi:hypothetical protein